MQQRLAETGRVRVGIGGFLILTHLLAGAVAVAVASQAQTRSTVSWVFVALALVAACATGWLLTIELWRNFHLVELALQRLANGQPIAEIPPGPRWPLTKLTALVNVLGARERQYGALRQQMLTHSEQAAVQEERNRLARDLHDSIKQQLFSINVQAAAAQARWEHDPHAAQRAIADVRRSAHEAMVEMRALLQQLRSAPLETVGLMEALRDQAEALGYRSGARVVTRFGELPSDDHLPPGTQDAIFRIAQEALSNVARHARADHVELHLELHDDALLLLVRDDGQGFDPQCASGGMGLGNMRERAQLIGGTITMESMRGSGTVLTVRVPLVQPVVQEDSMNAETKALVKRGIMWQAASSVVAVIVVGAFVAVSYYGSTVIERSAWLLWLPILIALVLGWWFQSQAKRIQQQLEMLFGLSSAPVERLRMANRYGNFVFNLLTALALPLTFLTPTSTMPKGSNVLLPVPFWGLVALVNLGLFLHSEQRYWRRLPVHELRPLLDKQIQTIRNALFTYVLLIMLFVYNGQAFLWKQIVWPPQTANDWWACIGAGLPVLLAGSFAVNLWRYWQARRLLGREVRV